MSTQRSTHRCLPALRAGKYLMLCLTAMISADFSLVPEPTIVTVNGEAEQKQVLDYLKRIEELR